jgi:hypothetical protein
MVGALRFAHSMAVHVVLANRRVRRQQMSDGVSDAIKKKK